MKVSSFAALVVAAVVAMTLVGCSAAAYDPPASSQTTSSSGTPTVSPVPTGSPTATATATAAATLNGFDLDAVYAACDAAVPADNWSQTGPIKPDPPHSDSFGLASADGYAKDHTNGDPNAIYVADYYNWGDHHYTVELCVATGNPAAPTVTYVRSLD